MTLIYICLQLRPKLKTDDPQCHVSESYPRSFRFSHHDPKALHPAAFCFIGPLIRANIRKISGFLQRAGFLIS